MLRVVHADLLRTHAHERGTRGSESVKALLAGRGWCRAPTRAFAKMKPLRMFLNTYNDRKDQTLTRKRSMYLEGHVGIY